MRQLNVPVGTRFNKLTVIEEGLSKFIGKSQHRVRYFFCRCECGAERIASLPVLRSNVVKSCGCDLPPSKNYIHGHTSGRQSRTYRTWLRLKSQCNNEQDIYYSKYGRQGIKVCDRWENSFENFLQDMGEQPDGLILERLSCLDDFSPQNCFWGLPTERRGRWKRNSS